MSALKRQARVAGILYLLIALTAPFSLLYVPGQLIVRGDATATAANIRASEPLLRLGIASELFHQVVCIFLVMALFRLFKGVNENRAWLMVILGALVSVPIVFLNVLNSIAALTLATGPEFLRVIGELQRDALAYLFMRLHGQGIVLASVFWGLWLFPFGVLVIRSGFIPRVLGVLLMIAGTGYLLSSFTSLVLPQYSSMVNQVAMIMEFGEIPITFWLLIWGVREQPSNAAIAPVTP